MSRSLVLILFGLDNDDWLDIDEYVFYMLGLGYMDLS